ncbi:hypothetical protein [Rhodanobacter lindaniclasticus]
MLFDGDLMLPAHADAAVLARRAADEADPRHDRHAKTWAGFGECFVGEHL